MFVCTAFCSVSPKKNTIPIFSLSNVYQNYDDCTDGNSVYCILGDTWHKIIRVLCTIASSSALKQFNRESIGLQHISIYSDQTFSFIHSCLHGNLCLQVHAKMFMQMRTGMTLSVTSCTIFSLSPVSPRFFPVLSLAIFFARAPPSKRLEQGESELTFQKIRLFLSSKFP